MDPSPDPFADLLDDRLPALATRAVAADWTAGIALGLLAALMLSLLASLLFRPRMTAADQALKALSASQKLPVAERLLAQVTALKTLAVALNVKIAPGWLAALGQKLGTKVFTTGPATDLQTVIYQPVPDVDPDALQQELTPLIKRLRR